MFESEPIRKSIYETTLNMLRVLAKHGDADAIEALRRADEMAGNVELIEDDGEETDEVIMEREDGVYIVTQHGATFIPNLESEA